MEPESKPVKRLGKKRTYMEPTERALKIARIILNGKKTLTTEYGRKTEKGIAALIDSVKPDKIIIRARLWFNKKTGNTYHSTKVYCKGELIGKKPFEHVYGDHFMVTAFKALQDAGIYPKTREQKNAQDADLHGFLDDVDKDRERFDVQHTDVARKRDL